MSIENAGSTRRAFWLADDSVPLLPTTVPGVLRDAAAAVPQRIALVSGAPDPAARRRWTYLELLEQSERLAHGLALRFEPGERVAVWAPNEPEWIVALFGIAMAGLVLVPINPVFRAVEVERALRHSEAAAVLYAREHRGNQMEATVDALAPSLPALRLRHRIDAIAGLAVDRTGATGLPEVEPGDVVQIQYTSGTTGTPKGARLHHGGLTNNARLMFSGLVGDDPHAVWVNPNPMFHLGGCGMGTLGPVQARATHVMVPSFDPGLVLELLESERGTVTGGVPTMIIALLEHPDFTRYDLSALRTVSSGGTTVPAELVRRIESELGASYFTMYGQTEASAGITQTSRTDATEDKAATVGRPLPHVAVRIVDPTSRQTVATGVAGELWARSPMAMLGYEGLPDITAQTLDADGWLHTGDIAVMDDRGYCSIVGRLKDMIVRGGENISPREIEDFLFAQPAVGDVAVIGVPDDRLGEQVAAFIRPAPGAEGAVDVDALRAAVRASLAPFKTPTYWYVVDELPLNATGKIQKTELRERWIATHLSGDAS